MYCCFIWRYCCYINIFCKPLTFKYIFFLIKVTIELTSSRTWLWSTPSGWGSTTGWLSTWPKSTLTGTTRPCTRKPGGSWWPRCSTSSTTSGCPSSSVGSTGEVLAANVSRNYTLFDIHFHVVGGIFDDEMGDNMHSLQCMEAWLAHRHVRLTLDLFIFFDEERRVCGRRFNW